MYNLVFEKVEGIDYEVAKRTRAFIEAWRDDPEEVRRNGFDVVYFNNAPWVIRRKSGLVTNIDLKN